MQHLFSGLKNNNIYINEKILLNTIYSFFFFNITFCKELYPIGVAKDWQVGFQLPATAIMEGIISFHDDLFVFLTLVLFFVVYLLYICLTKFSEKFRQKSNTTKKTAPKISIKLVHASVLEIIWTILPALILIVIAIPSFSLLYSIDEIVEPLLTFKAIAHQWYWTYELINTEKFLEILNHLSEKKSDFVSNTGETFDSYMIPEDELFERKDLIRKHRLLTVDNYLLIPTEVPVRILVSSEDVLHSWAVPSLGVKIDACPGRLNQGSLFIKWNGIYYGQCSEICGLNHGFMPIGIRAYDIGFSFNTLIVSREILTSIEPLLSNFSSLKTA